MKKQGFRIVLVNPAADEILGDKCYKTLLECQKIFEECWKIVDIFRPLTEVLPIVEQVIQPRKRHSLPYVVWIQLGIINEEAAEKARDAGLTVIMDKCIMCEHKQLFSKE
ncbi:MAG: CoA-binding protein [Candidatus Bathycorpusculaceae bacterium]